MKQIFTIGQGTLDVANNSLSAELMDAMLTAPPRYGDSIAGCTISS